MYARLTQQGDGATNLCAHGDNGSICGPAISLTGGGRKEIEKKILADPLHLRHWKKN